MRSSAGKSDKTTIRKDISGCRSGCGVMLYLLTGLFLILAGLFLLVLAASSVQHVASVGSMTLDDAVIKIVLPIALGLIAIWNGINYWRNAYLFWQRT